MNSNVTTRQEQGRTHVRWIILALLFWVSLSNFLDRSVLANLAPEMPRYLHLADEVTPEAINSYWQEHSGAVLAAVGVTQQEAASHAASWAKCAAYIKERVANNTWGESYWDMQTAFTAAYAISMLLMGRLMDLWGLKWGFALACSLWMMAEMLHAVAPEIGRLFGSALTGFLLCRFLLGLGEGGVSPAVIKAIAEWFPKSERALATGIASGASSVGGMLVPWLLPFFLVQFSSIAIGGVILGWRGMFLFTGGIDILLVAVWIFYYRDPAQHPAVNREELEYIESDSAAETAVKIPWRKLLAYRQAWAFIAAKSLTDGFWWFYLFGSPDFFYRKFGLGPSDRQSLLIVIYLISALGAVAGGWLAGKLIRIGWPISRARKATMLICALLAAPVFYSALTSNKWLAAALLTVAACGHQAWGANVYCLAGDMFPKRTIGSLTGIAGLCSTGASMALMYLIGQIVKTTGAYLPIFFMASGAYLFALTITHWLAPKLKPARIDEQAGLAIPQPAVGIGS